MDARVALFKEIIDSQSLVEDWDGEGAGPPTAECVAEALAFLEEMPYEFPLPEYMVHASGTVGFYWGDYSGAEYAEVEILGDGRIAYYVVQDGVRENGITKSPGRKEDGRDLNTTPAKAGRDKKAN